MVAHSIPVHLLLVTLLSTEGAPPPTPPATPAPGETSVASTDARRTGTPTLAEPILLPGTFGPRFSLQEENDLFGLTQRSDHFYTQGLRLSARWRLDADWRPGKRLPFGTHELWGLELGQNLYTPSDIVLTDLNRLRRDRPYAGYLYVGLTWDILAEWVPFFLGSDDERDLTSSQLNAELALGGIGPDALGGTIQRGFHELLRNINGTQRPFEPLGWGIYETRNRLSADLLLRYQFDAVRKSRALGRWSQSTGSVLAFQVSPRGRLDVGGLFDALGAGLEVRTGLITAVEELRLAPRFPFQLYVFGRADGRFIAYNGLIQAPLLKGIRPEFSPERLVGEAVAGFVLRVAPVELVVSQLWRTRELTPAPEGTPNVHNVGMIQLSYLP